MASDLLSTICREIDERLNELRPLLAERERLLVAAEALLGADRQDTGTAKKAAAKVGPRNGRGGAARRGSAAGASKRAAARASEAEPERKVPEVAAAHPQASDAVSTEAPDGSTAKPERAARGAAREAILGALEHGSHTVGELVVVTAMSAPNVNGNLRRLAAEGVVVKAEREGKAAWALVDAVS